MSEFLQSPWYAWLVLPLLIFLARIVDVSIATLRFMFIARGARWQAVIAGFFEALIWLIMISQIIQNLHNFMCFVAYAGGFAAGSYIGMRFEERLALGLVLMRVITQKPATDLVNDLREHSFGVTQVDAEGSRGPVCVLFMVMKRSRIKAAVARVMQFNPKAFYTIEDVRHVNQGVFQLPADGSVTGFNALARWRTRLK